jgi:uncharacterized membrane protein YdbT with pleckstrin-like domain
MFCSKCGAKNSDEAIFCQKCAFRLEENEEETRVRVSPRREAPAPPKTEGGEELEKQVFSIRPTMLFIKIGYAATVIGAFLLVALLATLDDWLGLNIAWWIFVLLGLALLLVPAFYHLKRNTVRYTLTESKIEIDQGFISQNTRNVPLRTIQDVAVSSSIPQRLLGFGNLIIENASEAPEGKIVLKNINSPKKYADVLLKQMRQLDK